MSSLLRPVRGLLLNGLRASSSASMSAVDFETHREVFQHKTSWELLRALAILRACSFQPLVDNSLQASRSEKYKSKVVAGD